MYIWTITAYTIDNPLSHPINAPKKRVFGFFTSEFAALRAVQYNQCDMHEYYYNYLVVEKMNEGIHPNVLHEMWYKWNFKYTKNCWTKCKKPAIFKKYANITNFAMG